MRRDLHPVEASSAPMARFIWPLRRVRRCRRASRPVNWMCRIVFHCGCRKSVSPDKRERRWIACITNGLGWKGRAAIIASSGGRVIVGEKKKRKKIAMAVACYGFDNWHYRPVKSTGETRKELSDSGNPVRRLHLKLQAAGEFGGDKRVDLTRVRPDTWSILHRRSYRSGISK